MLARKLPLETVFHISSK